MDVSELEFRELERFIYREAQPPRIALRRMGKLLADDMQYWVPGAMTSPIRISPFDHQRQSFATGDAAAGK